MVEATGPTILALLIIFAILIAILSYRDLKRKDQKGESAKAAELPEATTEQEGPIFQKKLPEDLFTLLGVISIALSLLSVLGLAYIASLLPGFLPPEFTLPLVAVTLFGILGGVAWIYVGIMAKIVNGLSGIKSTKPKDDESD